MQEHAVSTAEDPQVRDCANRDVRGRDPGIAVPGDPRPGTAEPAAAETTPAEITAAEPSHAGLRAALSAEARELATADALENIQGILLARRRAELQLLAAKEALRTSNQALRRALEDREMLLQSERAAREVAERASVVKDEFLATLSHELRTPLTAILGWSQILLTTDGGVDMRRGVESIARNARAQAQLIDDLLDMSRIISGKLRIELQPLDISALAAAAVDTVTPSAQAKHIRLITSIAPDAGVVNADAHRLQQVFWNVLSNAIKFTPAGGTVRVEVSRHGSAVRFLVQDDGPGIDADFLPFVFDRFRQADASTTRRHGGLGIGLAVAHHLVELHGGTIAAESPVPGRGRGSAFTVQLPLADAPVAALRGGGGGQSVADAEAEALRLSGLSVLVVDDDADSRALSALVLQRCGAVVATAADGSQAMQLLAQSRPDVLVCDIGLPGTDGFALLRHIRSLPPETGGGVPAIALTAFTRREDRTRAMAAGYQLYLAKPFDPDELVAAVGSLSLLSTGG